MNPCADSISRRCEGVIEWGLEKFPSYMIDTVYPGRFINGPTVSSVNMFNIVQMKRLIVITGKEFSLRI